MRTERRILKSWKAAIALAALCLMLVGGGGIAARVAAQDAASTAGSPFVGVWIAPPLGEETGSITTLSSDGIVVDHETDGTSAIGAWEATGPTSGTITFVFFLNEPADEFTGSVIIRATLEYDEATDTITASYAVTGALADGTIVFSSDELATTTLSRMPVQGPEMAGQPIEGLIGATASPEATPAS
jgi:hypothetical protein